MITKEHKIEDYLEVNIPEWEITLHDAQMANKGAHTHAMNKNIAQLRYCLDKFKKDGKSSKWKNFSMAAKSAQSLGNFLYLLSKGR